MKPDYRSIFHPKFPEVAVQCASCPFRIGNDAEFGAVVSKLRAAEGIPGPTRKKDIGFARMSIFMDVQKCGDFMCHCTAYDADMNVRPQSEFRQCAGATRAHREGKLLP